MKLEIPREKILEAVLTTERFSSKHVSLPILSSVLFTASGNMLVVKATNLDVGIEFSIPVKNLSGEWSFAVSPQSLKSFLSNVSEKNVVLEYNENVLTVSTTESSAKLMVTPSDDFPIIPRVSEGNRFTISGELFTGGVNSVIYSASLSSIKPELSSVYIYPSAEEVVFVATDSFRLSEKRIKMPKNNIKESILLPQKNTIEISKVLGEVNGEIEVVASKNQVSFEVENIYISSRAVDGVFPDYKQIIPKEFATEVVVLKEDLAKALKLTSGFIDSYQQVVFSVSPGKKQITLKTKSGAQGEASQTIHATGNGEELTITFNHRYLADCLQSIKSESVAIKLVGANKPVIITESSHPSFTYLVMPMNR
ncbi:MAG TPA: DNA polymerase III subunit beta [Candidatus Paceibacterota bacterium]|nr:DNA polymerase III subunit beta [Candidatus Paceibacterota bacterium]